MKTHPLILAMIALGATAAISAQDVAPPSFEAVSIKRNNSGPGGTRIDVQPGGINLINIALQPVVRLAYGIPQLSRIAGLPDWANSERFDIVARGTVPSQDRMRVMLQALLADRFKLVARKDMRALPAYALVRMSDEPLGTGLRVSQSPCTIPSAGGVTASGQRPSPQAAPCGPRPGSGPGRLVLTGSPLQPLVTRLAALTGRTVVDKTGLTGHYDLDLSFAPPPPTAAADAPNADQQGPSVFTALQEQLGLKLQAYEEPVEVLVIERIEHPTEN